MANLQETSVWEVGIYQLETSDPVMEGENGIDNRAPRQLANRTLWLKNELARQIGLVNQSINNANNSKADKAIQFTAGNGLTGGGDLSTARTLSLGTPSKITATTTNVAISNTHSHEIDKASVSVAGIVQLNDSLTSTATNQALTANMGKVLNESKLGNNGNQTLNNGFLTINNTVWAKLNFPLSDGSQWYIEASPTYKANQTGGLGIRFMNDDNNGIKRFYDLNKSDKNEIIAYQSWVDSTFVAHNEVVNVLNSAETTKPLSALQGKVLNEKVASIERGKFNKAGGVVNGNIYLAGSIKGNNDRDTGFEWPQDGVLKVYADGRERINIAHGGTILRTQEGISLTLQNDKNLVLYDEQNQPIFATNTVLSNIASKVNKAGDTMTGHLRLSYQNDWVGYAANNPTEGKNAYFDGQIAGIARGGLQIVSRGNGRYDTIIGVTPAGATTADRRVGGLTVSQDGLRAHAYGVLHEYFVKTRDNQTIDGNKTFTGNIVISPTNNNNALTLGVGTNDVYIKNNTADKYLQFKNDGTLAVNDNKVWLYSDRTDAVNLDDTNKIATAKAVKTLNDSKLSKTENAVSATKLQTARQIALTGAVTGNVNFGGSANVSINTTLKAIDRRDYTGTLTPTHPLYRTQSVSTAGSVEVLPNGKIIQYFTFVCPIIYFYRQGLSAFYREKLGVSNFAAEGSPLLELSLWTPMPNKVQEARMHLSANNNHNAWGEALEWVYDWDSSFNHQTNIKDKAYFAFRRWGGSQDEPVTFTIVVEGY